MIRFALIACGLALAACTASGNAAADNARTDNVQIANPASEHCLRQGGRLKLGGPVGQTGFCHLPDGRIVEEWALFRMQNSATKR